MQYYLYKIYEPYSQKFSAKQNIFLKIFLNCNRQPTLAKSFKEPILKGTIPKGKNVPLDLNSILGLSSQSGNSSVVVNYLSLSILGDGIGKVVWILVEWLVRKGTTTVLVYQDNPFKNV